MKYGGKERYEKDMKRSKRVIGTILRVSLFIVSTCLPAFATNDLTMKQDEGASPKVATWVFNTSKGSVVIYWNERAHYVGYGHTTTGDRVSVVQRLLTLYHEDNPTVSCDPLGVDGIFGDNTYNAVIAFQTHKGLSVDGVVGGATWGALLAYYTSKDRPILQIG
ncbi:MAG: peptidoglycan-binding domain-containing protein [Oscillospiraceae bacterium]|nr:peptidoglycan-binding domain-containing protein [Oscillospiraceae bacterium]